PAERLRQLHWNGRGNGLGADLIGTRSEIAGARADDRAATLHANRNLVKLAVARMRRHEAEQIVRVRVMADLHERSTEIVLIDDGAGGGLVGESAAHVDRPHARG